MDSPYSRKKEEFSIFFLSSSNLQRGISSKNENSEIIEKYLYDNLEKHLKISVMNGCSSTTCIKL